jgi:uncharacterized protein YdaU (DUF1376 family)
MKHYPHHISDFNNGTRHLSRLERSLYRDLVELYYETEKPLLLEVTELCRRIVANECSTDVERLLNEFFTETPLGWYHERCEEEISKYHANNSQKAQAGKASAVAKALKKQRALNGESTHVERPLKSVDTETERDFATINHQPSTNQPLGEMQPAAAKRAARKCPADFLVTPEMVQWADSECPGVGVLRATAKFRDHTFKTAIVDWPGAWRNWLRRDFDDSEGRKKLPAWREQQRSETQKAAPRIALGTQNPNTFFNELGATNVTAIGLG